MLKIKSYEVNKKGYELYGKVDYTNPKIPKALFVVASFIDNVTKHEEIFDNYEQADEYYNEVIHAN